MIAGPVLTLLQLRIYALEKAIECAPQRSGADCVVDQADTILDYLLEDAEFGESEAATTETQH